MRRPGFAWMRGHCVQPRHRSISTSDTRSTSFTHGPSAANGSQQLPARGRVRLDVLADAAVAGELSQMRLYGHRGHLVELRRDVGVDPADHVGNGLEPVAERFEDLPLAREPVVDVLLDPSGAVLDHRAVGGIDATDV